MSTSSMVGMGTMTLLQDMDFFSRLVALQAVVVVGRLSAEALVWCFGVLVWYELTRSHLSDAPIWWKYIINRLLIDNHVNIHVYIHI